MKRAPLKRQRGVALIVALILLVVMTLVGLAGMRTVTLQEKMTASTFDRSLAFQAAESALREAEAVVEAAATHPIPAAVLPATGTNKPRWEDPATVWITATPVANGSITVPPEYLVEDLGPAGACDSSLNDCHLYRITARIQNVTERSQVVLQSNYVAAP
jgi:type IV pilus assembly protein PilX